MELKRSAPFRKTAEGLVKIPLVPKKDLIHNSSCRILKNNLISRVIEAQRPRGRRKYHPCKTRRMSSSKDNNAVMGRQKNP